jgi:RNA polymerase sigma factor (sigma-70 family)
MADFLTDDDRLLAAWQSARDEAAFHALCARHVPLVAGTCRRLGAADADEATQAVFLILARRAGSVDGRLLAGWLTLTARRVVAQQRRAAERRQRHEQEAAMELARHQPIDVPDAAWGEVRPHLDAALASLSPKRREAILRFYLQGGSQADIAAQLGCSVEAVKTRVHEGLAQLRAFFARRGSALGLTALAAGLAAESAAAEPALAAACTQTILAPASALGAATLATGVTTAMTIKTAAFGFAVIILGGSCTLAGVLAAADAPPAVVVVPVEPQTSASLSPASDASANAALDWWRAIDCMPDDTHLIWKLAEKPDSALPDPVADDLFSKVTPSLDLLAQGASDPYCDWGLDLELEVFQASMPYAMKMRKLIRLGALRARWQAARGNGTAAVDDLSVCLRAGRLYAGRHAILMDKMLGFHCENMAMHAAGAIAPRLDAAQRRRFTTIINDLPAATSLAVIVDNECNLWRAFVRQLQALPLADRAKFFNQLGFDHLKFPKDELKLTDAYLQRSIDQIPIELERFKARLQLPIAERLKALEPTSATGEYLRLFTLASVEVFARGSIRTLIRLEQLRAALAYLDRGDAGLGAYPDPLTGQPFRLEKTDTGFRLLVDIPGDEKPQVLIVGEPTRAAIPDTLPAETPDPLPAETPDPPPEDQGQGSGF